MLESLLDFLNRDLLSRPQVEIVEQKGEEPITPRLSLAMTKPDWGDKVPDKFILYGTTSIKYQAVEVWVQGKDKKWYRQGHTFSDYLQSWNLRIHLGRPGESGIFDVIALWGTTPYSSPAENEPIVGGVDPRYLIYSRRSFTREQEDIIA